VNVLFVCVRNAGRSQIAEALSRRASDLLVTMGCGEEHGRDDGER
jgi:hypothetical protein